MRSRLHAHSPYRMALFTCYTCILEDPGTSVVESGPLSARSGSLAMGLMSCLYQKRFWLKRNRVVGWWRGFLSAVRCRWSSWFNFHPPSLASVMHPVVLDKGPLNGRCCSCCIVYEKRRRNKLFLRLLNIIHYTMSHKCCSPRRHRNLHLSRLPCAGKMSSCSKLGGLQSAVTMRPCSWDASVCRHNRLNCYCLCSRYMIKSIWSSWSVCIAKSADG